MSPSPPPYAPYGGYIVPVGAPYPSSDDPGALSPAPAPTSGADAHTTMVSAMKVGLVVQNGSTHESFARHAWSRF
jgi:hypothetical protein